MTTPSRFRGVLSALGMVLLSVPCPAIVLTSLADDPEDSPLYASSRQNVLAAMATRDHAPPGPGVAVGAGAIIVVEGTKWYTMPTSPRTDRPHPLDVTTDLTCSPMQCPTAASATCRTCVSYPTCSGNATCTPDATCNGTCTFYPTCAGSGQATCSGPTCVGATCAGPTCSIYYPTCLSLTCQQQVTCLGTCAPTQCPATLYNVDVPRAGEIEMSFSSSSYLKYVLQFCTNVPAGPWTEACTTNGTGGVLTLCHTNGAAMSLYRLLIQNR